HPRRHEQRQGIAEGHAAQDPIVSSAAPRRIEGVCNTMNLEAVRFVLTNAVLDDAVGGPVDRECLVTVRTIVDAAAATALSVAHGVGVAPPERDEPRAPDA